MRIFLFGPALFGGWIRPGISLGREDFARMRRSGAGQIAPSDVVYVIEGGGHVKIGVSNDPSSRLATLQTGSPFPLHMVAAIPTLRAYDIEAEAHAILASQRVNGEWFGTTKELAIAAVYGAASRLGVSIGNETEPAQTPVPAELNRIMKRAAIAGAVFAIIYFLFSLLPGH